MISIIKQCGAVRANAITHAGIFHADDVLAAAMLEMELGDVRLARVREVPEDMVAGTVVFDVGFGRFDHHQAQGAGERENGVPYAASGLLWKEFGASIVCGLCFGGDPADGGADASADVDEACRIVDERLVQSVDARDNGCEVPGDATSGTFTFSDAIASFNAATPFDEEAQGRAFAEAARFARAVLENVIRRAIDEARAKRAVAEAVEAARDGVMVLDAFHPWKESLLAMEGEAAEAIAFAVFPSARGGWNWQGVPVAPGSFDQRIPAPQDWRGLTGDDLARVCGVADATFCHKAGFMGAAASKEGAIAMARAAIEALVAER